MLKESEAGIDPYLGFLDFRNTPTEGLGTPPAQRLFGRRTKTMLPTSDRLLRQPEFDKSQQLKKKTIIRKRKKKIKIADRVFEENYLTISWPNFS